MTNVEISVGVSSLNFDEHFSKAKRHILLHAAIYNRFAENSAVASALETALANGAKIEVIILPVWHDIDWMDAACQLVRPYGTRSDMLEKAEASRTFFTSLAKQYPQQVVLYEAETLPAFPLVVVDDVLFYGHYAHSQVLAPEGFWMRLSSHVGTLLSLAESIAMRSRHESSEEGQLHEVDAVRHLSPLERAVFRLLQEWTAAKGVVIGC